MKLLLRSRVIILLSLNEPLVYKALEWGRYGGGDVVGWGSPRILQSEHSGGELNTRTLAKGGLQSLLKELQKGTRYLSKIKLETIHVMFSQEIWMYSVSWTLVWSWIQKLWGRLFGRGSFKGARSLYLVSFIMKFQIRKIWKCAV